MEKASGIINKCHWTIYNDDCLELMSRMQEESIDCMVTSPPYYERRFYSSKNIRKDGNIAPWTYSTSGQAIKGEVGNGCDLKKYYDDVYNFFKLSYKVLKTNKLLFVNIGVRRKGLELFDMSNEFIKQARKAGFHHWDTAIWIKLNYQPAGKYKKYHIANGWEYILIFSKGDKVDFNTDTGKPNYVESNIGCMGRKYKPLFKHFAPFRFEVPEYCLSIGAKDGDTIFDPFAGSGTSLQAGIVNNMNVIGCELVPEYFIKLKSGLETFNV